MGVVEEISAEIAALNVASMSFDERRKMLTRLNRVLTIAEELKAGVQELSLVTQIVNADMVTCGKSLNENASEPTDEREQFWRRAIVRCVFAGIEAVAYQMKMIALSVR